MRGIFVDWAAKEAIRYHMNPNRTQKTPEKDKSKPSSSADVKTWGIWDALKMCWPQPEIKRVNFSRNVQVVVIPNRNQFIQAGLWHYMRYSEEEENFFKKEALVELNAFKRCYPHLTGKEALKQFKNRMNFPSLYPEEDVEELEFAYTMRRRNLEAQFSQRIGPPPSVVLRSIQDYNNKHPESSLGD